jgi:hypothetical protein
MRAAVFACGLAAALALAGCAGASDNGTPPASTGLVLSLHFDHFNVQTVSLNGSTFATSRRFGPYVVDENDLPRDSTVGFVFDADDAGTAMICGESHDDHGNVMQAGCDYFDVVAASVTKGSLTLVDPTPH